MANEAVVDVHLLDGLFSLLLSVMHHNLVDELTENFRGQLLDVRVLPHQLEESLGVQLMLLLLRHHLLHVSDTLGQLRLFILVFFRQLFETVLGKITEDFFFKQLPRREHPPRDFGLTGFAGFPVLSLLNLDLLVLLVHDNFHELVLEGCGEPDDLGEITAHQLGDHVHRM